MGSVACGGLHKIMQAGSRTTAHPEKGRYTRGHGTPRIWLYKNNKSNGLPSTM
ncbi:hypothetical protein K449DRAFT_385295 [Hypoxylon sp. EC38]|nr:hypothetical protein K449DRAFT_385295 [Hypoxylon sp. EC38]